MSKHQQRREDLLRREEAAKRARAEAQALLAPVVSAEPSRGARDNTLESLARDRTLSPAARPTVAASPAPRVVVVQEDLEWESVELGVYRHVSTGCCALERTRVRGGLREERAKLPVGWKIVKAAEGDGMGKFFYWNMKSGETKWAFPKIEEAEEKVGVTADGGNEIEMNEVIARGVEWSNDVTPEVEVKAVEAAFVVPAVATVRSLAPSLSLFATTTTDLE
jgi:hypothetical protein